MWVSMCYKAWPWIKNICSPDTYNNVVELKTRAERKCCGLGADAGTFTLLQKASAPWDLGQGRLLKASKMLLVKASRSVGSTLPCQGMRQQELLRNAHHQPQTKSCLKNSGGLSDPCWFDQRGPTQVQVPVLTDNNSRSFQKREMRHE